MEISCVIRQTAQDKIIIHDFFKIIRINDSMVVAPDLKPEGLPQLGEIATLSPQISKERRMVTDPFSLGL